MRALGSVRRGAAPQRAAALNRARWRAGRWVAILWGLGAAHTAAWAQVEGAQSEQEGAQSEQEDTQTEQEGAQTGSDDAQTGSDGAQTGSDGAQIGSDDAQTGSDGAQTQDPWPADLNRVLRPKLYTRRPRTIFFDARLELGPSFHFYRPSETHAPSRPSAEIADRPSVEVDTRFFVRGRLGLTFASTGRARTYAGGILPRRSSGAFSVGLTLERSTVSGALFGLQVEHFSGDNFIFTQLGAHLHPDGSPAFSAGLGIFCFGIEYQYDTYTAEDPHALLLKFVLPVSWVAYRLL